jgi:hypothetical protein
MATYLTYKVGQRVTYTTSDGYTRNAIVTAVNANNTVNIRALKALGESGVDTVVLTGKTHGAPGVVGTVHIPPYPLEQLPDSYGNFPLTGRT